jgi:hypothetical protein
MQHCSCHLMQNGQLKARIEGANTPMLSAQILALTPANADMDDLEVRELSRRSMGIPMGRGPHGVHPNGGLS